MHLSVISPEKIVFTGDVEMVVLSGAKGDFGVLDRHTPFMTMLKAGPLTIYQNGQKSQVLTLAGGFCEVTPDGCLVLADAVEQN